MLPTEPLVSIDVHNMRENPSLVPESMVAFKMNPQIKEKKKTCVKAHWAQGGHPVWLRVSLRRVDRGGNPVSVRQSPEQQSTRLPVIYGVLRHRTSIPSAALWEENTRCCVWSLAPAALCHGNADQTACTRGVQAGRERAGRERAQAANLI